MVVGGLFKNIFADPSAMYSSIPLGSQLLRSEIVTEAGGARVRVDYYTNPYKGNFTLRTPLTQAERRAQLVPYNPLLSTAPPMAKPDTPVRGQTAVDPTQEKRADSTTDRRSIPRPDRDSRAPNPAGDGAEFGKDRRVGSPLTSFFAELKSFFLRPAGIVTLGVVLFVAWRSIRKR